MHVFATKSNGFVNFKKCGNLGHLPHQIDLTWYKCSPKKYIIDSKQMGPLTVFFFYECFYIPYFVTLLLQPTLAT